MHKILLFAAPLALASCGGADEAAVNNMTNDMAVEAPAADNEVVNAANEMAGGPSPYLEGKPGQPAIPETVEDPDWTKRYSPDMPYYNRGKQAIPATMGASPRTALVGMVEPGEGGFIETCELNSTYCKISFGGSGLKGYVNMDLMSGHAL